MIGSPFERVPPISNRASLPAAFRAQFLGTPEDGTQAFLVGTMDRVWHRYRWLTPILWLLAQANTLFPETGRNVPATMTVRSYRDRRCQPWQSWQRTFTFVQRRRHFDARMTVDLVHGRAVEHTGPGGLLEVPWRIDLREDRLQIDALSVALRLGSLRLRLPDVCCVRVRAIETADPAHPNQIQIDLSLTHPWLGPVFGYDGTFRVERRPVSS